MFRTRSHSGGSSRRSTDDSHNTVSRFSFRKLQIHSGRRSSSSRPNPNPPIVSSEQRIYGPNNLGFGDDDISADKGLESGIGKVLLAKIERCYEGVHPVEVGFCFGLLDPVCNIVVGHAIAIYEKSCPDKQLEEKEEEEEEEEEPVVRSINQRSLDGLVAFLVALFPYLTSYRAMWYLNKADLDPLLAARLIIKHRGMEQTFGFASDTTVAAVETALRCAAAAAQHPNPRQFALGWKLLSTSLHKVATMLQRPYATQDPSQFVDLLPLLSLSPTQPPPLLALQRCWDIASARLPDKHPEMPPVPQPTVRRMLLTTIHGYYLQALACLPKDKLRSHYHHSLLHAGHCYGPLDPVSNIIVNTLWYAQVFPLEKNVEIEAISTNALLRIAARSLYGLISFLCTCYPSLEPGEAMRRLQQVGADLQKAQNPNLGDCGVEEEAYAAAAKAAHHPKPLQQAQFLGPSNSMLKAFSQLLMHQEPDKFSRLLVEYFPTAVASSSKPEETTQNNNVLGPWHYSRVMATIDEFWNQHTRAMGMVKSAIELFNKQYEVPGYELHVICGVNEFVNGPVPVRATPSDCCSHINFLATRTAGSHPELFFAESRKGVVSLCCPVPMPLPCTEQVRCLHCEFTGSRIVHPAKESFRGRDSEFEKMLGGQRVFSERHTNDGIISCSHYNTLWVNSLEEDQIYVDYSCDNNIEVGRLIDDF